jgi:hypothetical protein
VKNDFYLFYIYIIIIKYTQGIKGFEIFLDDIFPKIYSEFPASLVCVRTSSPPPSFAVGRRCPPGIYGGEGRGRGNLVVWVVIVLVLCVYGVSYAGV